MIKWKLMATTLPFVALALLAKLAFERILGLPGYVDFSDVSAVLTAGAFLIGFMLAGTLADYKESEKLPGELACSLEAVEDTLLVCSFRKDLDLLAMRRRLLNLTEAICGLLAKQRTAEQVMAELSEMNATFMDIDKAGGTPHAIRGLNELANLRKAVTRIDVIARTGFLSSGYAILEVIVASVIALLVVSRFKGVVSEYTLITFITLVYVYMLRLIRDVDDPFEYGPDLVKRGSAEVDLFPLLRCRERIRARVG